MTAAAPIPREARLTLHRFQALQARLDEIGRRSADGSLAQTTAEDGTAQPATALEEAQAAFAMLRGTLIDLGATPRASTHPMALGDLDVDYVLACYADETLLHRLKWRGALSWSSMLLERSLYGSRIAGERLFELADDLTTRGDVGRRELAAALYLALAFGFRGKWRGIDDGGAVADCTDALYELVIDRSRPLGIELPSRFAQASAHTATAPLDRPPGQARRWAMLLAGLVCGYLVIAQVMWWARVDPASDLAERIIASPRPVPPVLEGVE